MASWVICFVLPRLLILIRQHGVRENVWSETCPQRPNLKLHVVR